MTNDERAPLLPPLEQARKALAVTLEVADDAIGRENVFGEQVVTVRWMRSVLTPILADLDAALSAAAPDAALVHGRIGPGLRGWYEAHGLTENSIPTAPAAGEPCPAWCAYPRPHVHSLPTTASPSEVPTDWAVVATRMQGAVAEVQTKAEWYRAEAEEWRNALDLTTAERMWLDDPRSDRAEKVRQVVAEHLPAPEADHDEASCDDCGHLASRHWFPGGCHGTQGSIARACRCNRNNA